MDFRGVAHELIQFRGGELLFILAWSCFILMGDLMTAHLHGKPTARGPTIQGTPEAMHDELYEVVQTLRGPKGDEMREKARQLGRQIEQDVAPGGASYEMMVRIGSLGG